MLSFHDEPISIHGTSQQVVFERALRYTSEADRQHISMATALNTDKSLSTASYTSDRNSAAQRLARSANRARPDEPHGSIPHPKRYRIQENSLKAVTAGIRARKAFVDCMSWSPSRITLRGCKLSRTLNSTGLSAALLTPVLMSHLALCVIISSIG